jgi:hypothetical protein
MLYVNDNDAMGVQLVRKYRKNFENCGTGIQDNDGTKRPSTSRTYIINAAHLDELTVGS